MTKKIIKVEKFEWKLTINGKDYGSNISVDANLINLTPKEYDKFVDDFLDIVGQQFKESFFGIIKVESPLIAEQRKMKKIYKEKFEDRKGGEE